MAEPLAVPPFDQITFEDPRVLRLCGAQWASLGAMSVANAVAASRTLDGDSVLADAIPALNEWVRTTAAATLDDLAQELLTAWEHTRTPVPKIRKNRARIVRRRDPVRAATSPPLEPAARDAVLARFGLTGAAPTTLQHAGDMNGLTRERVRQLCAQIEAAACRWVWAPALDDALRLADGTHTGHDYTRLLQDKGLTRRPWQPASVQSLARLCGRTDRLTLALPENHVATADATAIRQLATTLIQHKCLAAIAEIAAAATSALDRTVTGPQVVAAVEHSPRHVVAGQWVGPRSHRQPGGRLPLVATRLLALSHHTGATITATHIRYGVERRLRQDGLRHVPPLEAIAAYLDAHPDFTISDSTNPTHAVAGIRSQPLPLDQHFGKAAMVLIDFIRSRPGQIAARHEILHHAQYAGIGVHAARQVLSYHEALTRQDNRLWTLTGITVTPKATAAAQAALPPKPRTREGNTTDGRPWWTFTVTPQWRRHKVVERQSMTRYPGRYQATTPDGGEYTLGITPAGALRGLHHYVAACAIVDGATLKIVIDPASASVVIRQQP